MLRDNDGMIMQGVFSSLDSKLARQSSPGQLTMAAGPTNRSIMEPLVERVLSKLGPTVTAYMGLDAELTSYNLMRINPKSQAFSSSNWHHDRCGKRLKVFIYLGRVDEATHATELAAGSHRTTYYSYADFWQSRIRKEYVDANYEKVHMYGEEGGGFIFDTNTLHRAHLHPQTRQRRDAVVFEFMMNDKAEALLHLPNVGQCSPHATHGMNDQRMLRLRISQYAPATTSTSPRSGRDGEGWAAAAAAAAAVASPSPSQGEALQTNEAYARYVDHQRSKLGVGKPVAEWIKGVDKAVQRQVVSYLRGREDHIHSPVLCVGARLGGEVRAFQSMPNVQLAIGVDFNPGDRNPNVMWGDAHTLSQFKNHTFGSVYTNVVDHFLYVEQFVRSAHRVLRPGGTLLMELFDQPLAKDQWAVQDLGMEARARLLRLIQESFELVARSSTPKSRRTGTQYHYIFRKAKT